MNDAVDSLRRHFAGSLLILGIFFFALPAARQQLKLFEASRDLTAWVLLREKMLDLVGMMDTREEGPDGLFSQTETNEEIGTIPSVVPGPVRGPEDVTWRTDSLRISSEWPSARSYPIVLTPIRLNFIPNDESRLYQVKSEGGELPLSDYRVVFVRYERSVPEEDRVAIVAAKSPLLARILEAGPLQQRFLEQSLHVMNRPRAWDLVSYRLTKYGFHGEPTSLSSTDVSLQGLKSEADPRSLGSGVQILGIRLGLGEFFSLIGVFLGVLAFSMLGPVLLLGSASDLPRPSSWILMVPRGPGLMRGMLESAVIVLSALWVLIPVAVLVLQARMLPELAPVSGAWAIWLGAVGLTFAASVHAVASRRLLRLRRSAGGRPGAGEEGS